MNNIYDLIKTGEGYTLELKERFNSSIGKEICAFANASGGKIILGIKDSGEIIGFNLTNTIKSQIQDIARNMDPSFHVNVDSVDNIVVIYVPEGKEKPYFVNGHSFLRYGANSCQLKRNEIRNFFRKENLIEFDRKSNPDFDFNDFNENAFNLFVKNSGISSSLSKELILRNVGLFTEDKLNNSGVLFFSNDISKYFLNSVVACVLYAGKTKTKILDKQELGGDFFSNFNDAVKFSLRNLRTEYIIEKVVREERSEISESVLRELIVNAMIHRDYFSNGRVIIEIFSDRVEISNPGGLLFDEKDFGKISISRNPILVDLVLRLGIVEKVGSGITRVRDALKNNVVFEISSDWFRVIIRRDNELGKISEKIIEETTPKTTQKTTQKILELLKQNPKYSRKELSELIEGITEDGIKYNLKKLKNEGKIKRIGPDKGGHWEVLE
ncbi:MAG: winged helix-turn-helix transcriptional regulator [ANME-2 cluster archaeon]|nr:winged helix-turn-helix transcriptional regulator [ANME-2 cluster archaeon]MBC2747007.1 winged helix-turn-helix transcriptional regulator [ANME-2 cluster archaeon]